MFSCSWDCQTIHQPGMVCHSNLCLLSCCLDLNCTVPAVCLYKHVPDHSSSLWNIFCCMYLTGCKPSCLCLYKAKPHYHRLLAQLWKNIEDLLVAPSSLWNQYNVVFRNSIYAQPHSKQINSSQWVVCVAVPFAKNSPICLPPSDPSSWWRGKPWWSGL